MWEKWTFPLADVSLPSPEAQRWLSVQKVRRRRSFALADGRSVERPLNDAELPGCTVELTEATVGDEPWWTLCFEATGTRDRLDQELLATAALILPAGGLPAELQLDARDSMSYVRWLGSRRNIMREHEASRT